MKKLLLGTMALVAGAFAGIGATQAQDMMVPMKAGVGGYYTIAAISSSTDGADDRGHGIQQNIELQFQGDMELDNGITAGVRIRINGNNNGGMHGHPTTAGDLRALDTALAVQAGQEGYIEDDAAIQSSMAGGDNDNVSETEVYFKGAFGALHAGMIEGAAQQMTVWAPGGTVPIGGIKSPWFGGIGGLWTSGNFMDEDSNKIVYFSPSFNGVSLGVSYAPEDTNYSYAGRADNEGEQGEQLTAALSYGADVMGGSFSANIGYETHSTESTANAATMMNDPCDSAMMNCDPVGWRYGASVSIDQIAIGGAVYNQEGTGAMGADTTMTDVGVSWTQGALMLGIQHGSIDAGAVEHSTTTFNANYNLGPGVDVGAVIHSGETAGADFTKFLLGTMFNF